jgi:hypothetical protein
MIPGLGRSEVVIKFTQICIWDKPTKWDDDIPSIWKVIKTMFQTTSQFIYWPTQFNQPGKPVVNRWFGLPEFRNCHPELGSKDLQAKAASQIQSSEPMVINPWCEQNTGWWCNNRLENTINYNWLVVQ